MEVNAAHAAGAPGAGAPGEEQEGDLRGTQEQRGRRRCAEMEKRENNLLLYRQTQLHYTIKVLLTRTYVRAVR